MSSWKKPLSWCTTLHIHSINAIHFKHSLTNCQSHSLTLTKQHTHKIHSQLHFKLLNFLNGWWCDISELPPHPHVVQVYGISIDGPQPVLVMEYCAGGNQSSHFHYQNKTVFWLNNIEKFQLNIKSNIIQTLFILLSLNIDIFDLYFEYFFVVFVDMKEVWTSCCLLSNNK
jgi:serine/threonine protein kinase